MLDNIIHFANKTQKQQEYQDYLQSPHWQGFRAEAIEFYGKQCYYPECNRIDEDGCFCNMNHLNYDHVGNEILAYVLPLCEWHHWCWHEGLLGNPYWIINRQERKLDEAGLVHVSDRIDWSLIRDLNPY